VKYLFFFFCFLFNDIVFGQSTFLVKEYQSELIIPFVKIEVEGQEPRLTGLDGDFIMDTSQVKFLHLSVSGYQDSLIETKAILNNVIYLKPETSFWDEVRVLPGENPAHRIMNQVIANKNINNPEKNDAFTYTSYSKFVFDIHPEAFDSIVITDRDTTLQKMKDFFNAQHFLLIESASQRAFIPPTRNKEEITAYQVSGFSSPALSTMANEMQSFSFYNNQFEISGSSYLSPIAFGSTNRYFFLIEDTTFSKQDTVFHISFRPKKGKDFEGMKGMLYINSNGYAIEKVVAEPFHPKEELDIRIIQEYTLLEGKKWFPSKLSTEATFPTLKISDKLDKGFLIAKGNTYIKDVRINPPGLKIGLLENTYISTLPDADKVIQEAWDTLRTYVITDKELATYRRMDSLNRIYHFDKKLSFAESLAQGLIPLGYFNMNVNKLYNFNQFEGNRWGLGLETSQKLSKKVIVGGYFAYGFWDKQWKKGGYTDFRLNQKKFVFLNLSYEDDVVSVGGSALIINKDGFQATDLLNQIYINRMDYQRKAQVGFSGYLLSNLKWGVYGNYQRIGSSDSLVLKSNPEVNFDLAETVFELKWNIKEKVIVLGNTRIANGTKYPKIQLQFRKGWKDIFNASQNYARLNTSISQKVNFLRAGEMEWCLKGGITWGSVPLLLQQQVVSSGRNKGIDVPFTFQTMLPSTYFSQEFIAFFQTYRFKPFPIKAKLFQPQMGIYHGIGIGRMDKQLNYLLPFESMQKGYAEAGLLLDGLLVSGTSKIGIGVYYHYSNTSFTNWKENLFLKLRVRLT
jgi:hypothetical protein